jgi:hypothetical protein
VWVRDGTTGFSDLVDLGIDAGVCQQTIERGHVRHGGRPPAFTQGNPLDVGQSVSRQTDESPACIAIGEVQVRGSKLCSATS